MSDEKEEKKGVLKARPGRLELKTTVNAGQVRQSFSHGRTKSVSVEVRRKRTFTQGAGGTMEEVKRQAAEKAVKKAPTAEKVKSPDPDISDEQVSRSPAVLRTLTEQEAAARASALEGARADDTSSNKILERTVEGAEARRVAAKEAEEARKAEEERRQEEDNRKLEEAQAAKRAAEQAEKLKERMAARKA